MSRVFLTGATGVIGRRAVPRLIDAGHQVTAVTRTDAKSSELRSMGAMPVALDLFDADAVRRAVDGHDAVVHLATSIPTGASAATKRGWAMNDRLRSEASRHLSRAAIDTGAGRYVHESITFPYVDGGNDWIDETTERTFFWGNHSTVDAEEAAAAVTAAGGVGVTLRFAMFMADDSAHMRTFAKMAAKGIWGIFGDDDAYMSFVHIDDAASAVASAIEAPPGVFNVAEVDPGRRRDHRSALAATVGRARLRSLPRAVQIGEGAASLARSHRISSAALRSATGWTPTRHPIDTWKDLAWRRERGSGSRSAT